MFVNVCCVDCRNGGRRQRHRHRDELDNLAARGQRHAGRGADRLAADGATLPTTDRLATGQRRRQVTDPRRRARSHSHRLPDMRRPVADNGAKESRLEVSRTLLLAPVRTH